MKTIGQVCRDECIGGRVYDFCSFLEYVANRSITSYDGSGTFHDGENKTNKSVDVDELYFIIINYFYDYCYDEDDLYGIDFSDENMLPEELKEMKNKYPYIIWYNG